jgi:hypothetical protein
VSRASLRPPLLQWSNSGRLQRTFSTVCDRKSSVPFTIPERLGSLCESSWGSGWLTALSRSCSRAGLSFWMECCHKIYNPAATSSSAMDGEAHFHFSMTVLSLNISLSARGLWKIVRIQHLWILHFQGSYHFNNSFYFSPSPLTYNLAGHKVRHCTNVPFETESHVPTSFCYLPWGRGWEDGVFPLRISRFFSTTRNTSLPLRLKKCLLCYGQAHVNFVSIN